MSNNVSISGLVKALNVLSKEKPEFQVFTDMTVTQVTSAYFSHVQEKAQQQAEAMFTDEPSVEAVE